MSYSNFPAVIYERSRGPHDSEDGPDSVDLDKHMEGVVNLLKLLEPLCPTTKVSRNCHNFKQIIHYSSFDAVLFATVTAVSA